MALRRTTLEIDDGLLERARRCLGMPTMRATIEESLRRVVEEIESEGAARARLQSEYLANLARHSDLGVLASEEMWR